MKKAERIAALERQVAELSARIAALEANPYRLYPSMPLPLPQPQWYSWEPPISVTPRTGDAPIN